MQTKLRWLPSLRLGQLKVFNWVWLRNFIWDLHFISKMQQQRWDQFTPPLEMHTFPIFIFKIQHCHWNQPLFGLFYNFSYQCSAANIHHCLYFAKNQAQYDISLLEIKDMLGVGGWRKSFWKVDICSLQREALGASWGLYWAIW